jgi:trehalose-phosphatase
MDGVKAEVAEKIRGAQSASLFLDFDGTLVPIAPDPRHPRLDSVTAQTLEGIVGRGLLTVAVISGRAVEDLYCRIRLDGVIYAGNHGMEIFGRGLGFVEPVAWSRREALAELCGELCDQLREYEGVMVENKGLTASVHYRMAAAEVVPCVFQAVYDAVERSGGFRLNPGRKVYEIAPRTNWNKGMAAKWINQHLRREPAFTVYIGDDTTDEDAFAALGGQVTVKVGPASDTLARYHLPDPCAVQELLGWLAEFDPASL